MEGGLSRAGASSDEAELAPVHVRETAWVDTQPCTTASNQHPLSF